MKKTIRRLKITIRVKNSNQNQFWQTRKIKKAKMSLKLGSFKVQMRLLTIQC